MTSAPRRGRGSRLLAALALVLLLAVGGFWLAGGFVDKVAPRDLPPPAGTVPQGLQRAAVRRIADTAYECASGTLESASRATVSARILSRIEEVRVAAGDEVAAGDLLIVLDARDLQARVRQAQDALHSAEAELSLAQSEEVRAQQLLERGVGTRQRYDRALSQRQVAAAQVERLRRGLEEAETALSHAEIRAPVAGRVVDRLAEPGDIAAPGAPLLRLYDPQRLRVEAPVRESLAVGLRVGDPIAVQVAALDAGMAGVIDEIVPYAEPGARTLLVKVSLPQDRQLLGGIFARIAVPAGERAGLYIPAAAVERIGQLEFVTVLPGEGGTAERRLVTTGRPHGRDLVEVLSGLQEGEAVLWPAAASPDAGAPAKAGSVTDDGPCTGLY